MSKTLNKGCADLEQYPASKAHQLAKKLESSKATVRYIKQATSNPQSAQINLLRHQQTELAHKKKKGHKHKQHFKSKDGKPLSKKLFNPSQAHSSSDHCSKCGDTKHAQNVPFQWGPEHTEAFTSIKQEIIQAPVLKYYDPKKPTVLQTDASAKGLGACLPQCEHPVYFGIKALTDSQKGYVAIELEALAVSWAMEKFHHFLC